MDMTINQQVALDKALVPHASRLRIGKSNFFLRSNITSKESTLQLVYNVLRLNPFYKPFLVTTDILEIYMQLPGYTFDELPFEEEILAFLRFLRHNGEIRKLTDAQILWGMYHKKNVDFAYLLWEDFVYQVEHKDAKKINGMYYPRFTKVIIHYFMTKDPSIIRRNKQTHISQASGSGADEGTGTIPGVPVVPTNESDEEMSWKSSDEDDDDDFNERGDDQDDDDQDDYDDDQDIDDDNDDFVHPKLSIYEEAKDEESFDPIAQTPENSDDEGNDDASLGLNIGSKEGKDAEDDDEELYRDVNINLEDRDSSSVSSQFVTSMLNLSPDAGIDYLFETTPRVDVQASTTVALITLTAPTLPPPTFPTIPQVPQAPTPPTTAPITFLQIFLNLGSLFGFDHCLKTLEANISKFVKTNQFAGSVSSICMVVERYMDQKRNEAVKVVVQIQSDRLWDEAQAENEEFLKNLNENIQKIIQEQVKEQVKIKMKNHSLDQTRGPRGEEKENSQSAADDQPIAEASQHLEWFEQQKKPPTPDRAWNKTLPATHESIQPWISDLARQADSRSSFNQLMDTPADFSAFLMN
nr:hypothetical protein [Tanacetum cinerariifolium]